MSNAERITPESQDAVGAVPQAVSSPEGDASGSTSQELPPVSVRHSRSGETDVVFRLNGRAWPERLSWRNFVLLVPPASMLMLIAVLLSRPGAAGEGVPAAASAGVAEAPRWTAPVYAPPAVPVTPMRPTPSALPGEVTVEPAAPARTRRARASETGTSTAKEIGRPDRGQSARSGRLATARSSRGKHERRTVKREAPSARTVSRSRGGASGGR